MPSIRCLCDLDTVPGFFFFPEVLGHQQITKLVGYQIPPFWPIKETSLCKHFHFPTKKNIFVIERTIKKLLRNNYSHNLQEFSSCGSSFFSNFFFCLLALFRQLRVHNSNQFYWRQHATTTWILSLAQTKMEGDYHGGPGMTLQIRSREE